MAVAIPSATSSTAMFALRSHLYQDGVGAYRTALARLGGCCWLLCCHRSSIFPSEAEALVLQPFCSSTAPGFSSEQFLEAALPGSKGQQAVGRGVVAKRQRIESR